MVEKRRRRKAALAMTQTRSVRSRGRHHTCSGGVRAIPSPSFPGGRGRALSLQGGGGLPQRARGVRDPGEEGVAPGGRGGAGEGPGPFPRGAQDARGGADRVGGGGRGLSTGPGDRAHRPHLTLMRGVAEGDPATSRIPYMPARAWPGTPQIRRYRPGVVAVNTATADCPGAVPSRGVGVSAPGKAGWGRAVTGGVAVKGMTWRLWGMVPWVWPATRVNAAPPAGRGDAAWTDGAAAGRALAASGLGGSGGVPVMLRRPQMM